MRMILPRARGFVGVVALLSLAIVVGALSRVNAQGMPLGTQAAIRVFDFNTETTKGLSPVAAEGVNRRTNCPHELLQYSMDKSVFLALYLKREKIEVATLQEMKGICERVPLTKDAQGRPIPDASKFTAPGSENTIATVAKFKTEFQAKYNYQGRRGSAMSTAAFEQELQRVLGKQTFDDVWVRFLPFDETFWTDMMLVFVENYPMQVTAKPFSKHTFNFRNPIFSRLPYSRGVNFRENAEVDETDDAIPILPLNNSGKQMTSMGDGSIRWIVRAPIKTPMGNINFYDVHTRNDNNEACHGVQTVFRVSEMQNQGGSLYLLGGDFNQELKNRLCMSNVKDEYTLLDWGEGTAIDYLVFLKNTALSYDPNSRIVHSARRESSDPQPNNQEGPPSDHNGFSYKITGPKTQYVEPIASVKFPDYFPHEKQASSAQPPTVAGNSGQPGNQPVPICSTTDGTSPSPTGTVNLAGEIEEFFAQGASGYLVWQYSGDAGLGTEFASDPYSFFRNKPDGLAVCQTLKASADKHPDKYVGVNMWDAGNSKHSQAKVAEHFSWLKSTCGVTVVRTFSKEGGAEGAQKLLAAASSAGIKVMFAIGDYSNGGGGIPSDATTAFYTSQYSGEYQQLATAVMNATSGNGALYGYELANEAHCRGDQTALEPYKNWGQVIGGILRGGSNNVGYGQKASENTTLCDSPGAQAPSGVSHFQFTNSLPEITMTSGHYYNTAEKTLALEALTQSKGLGKPYYIGEAPATIANGNFPSSTVACINPDKYYIQPINGVNNGIMDTSLVAGSRTGDQNNFQTNIIRDDLIMQGYEARCAAPGFNIKLTENGRDAMNRLFIQPGIRGVVMGGAGFPVPGPNIDTTPTIYSRLDVDYRDILVPLYRDLDRSQPQLKRSIEDFFGFQETADSAYTSAEIKTGAINSLLTIIQRCSVVFKNLEAQDIMCKKLENPDQCALYETKIPNTSETVKTLYAKMVNNGASADSIQSYCQTMMAAKDANSKQLQTAVTNAPLTIDKAYRLAFMVTSIRLRPPSQSKLLNLFTHPLGGWMGPPKPKHAVVVVAFKIPDILTNKGYNDGSTVDTAYDDAARLTRNTLITKDTQAELIAESKVRREDLIAKGRELSNQVLADDELEILCIGGAGVSGVASPQCKDPLTKALVDLINAQASLAKEQAGRDPGPNQRFDFGDLIDSYEGDGELRCESDAETATLVNDPGELNAPSDPSHVFQQNYGAALLANLFGDCTHDGEGGGSPSYASTQDPGTGACSGDDWYMKSKFFVVENYLAGGGDDSLAVKHFLVYPMGYELRTVESVLAGSFFTKQQLADILELQKNSPSAAEKMVDQFRMENDKVAHKGGEDSYSYKDVVDCPTETVIMPGPPPYTIEIEKCPTRSFGFRLIADAAKPAAILGAKLGYWMRKIQLELNATTQDSWGYLKTCSTLEQYLTDTCGGGTISSKPPPGQSGNPNGVADPNWRDNGCNSSTTLDEIKYSEKSSLPITGRATYYAPTMFTQTLNNRKSGGIFGGDFVNNTTVLACELAGDTFAQAQAEAAKIGQPYVGCVALLRTGDQYYAQNWGTPQHDPNAIRSVWLKNSTGEVHGPFAVIDVAAKEHAPCLYDEGWAVDMDYNSFKRLFKQVGGPDSATVCDDQSCN